MCPDAPAVRRPRITDRIACSKAEATDDLADQLVEVDVPDQSIALLERNVLANGRQVPAERDVAVDDSRTTVADPGRTGVALYAF
jgi:hypothetical protein